NGIYWVSVDGPPDRSGRVPITNMNDEGRPPPQQRYGRVENELVHPLVRGRDVSRWDASPSAQILFVQYTSTRRGIDEDAMRTPYSGAFDFLSLFETELRARRGLRALLRSGAPWWSMFGVGQYTLAKHKVVWKDQASDFAAAVMPVADPLPLPNHKV